MNQPCTGHLLARAAVPLGVVLVGALQACADRGAEGGLSPNPGTDTGTALLRPAVETVGVLASAPAPVLAGWREGGRVWLVGGNTPTGVAARGVWEAGGGCLDVDPGGALWWVDGTPDGPVVAVGDGGTVRWLRGDPPEPPEPPTQADLYGVEVLSDGSLHVVGATVDGRGEAWRWTEADGWVAVLSDLDGVLFKVQDGWLAGQGWWGRWDAERADAGPTLTPQDWRGVIAVSDGADCAWMGGREDGRPVVAHACVDAFTVLDGPGVGTSIAGLVAEPDGHLWAATADGLPASRSPDSTWATAPFSMAQDLHGVVSTDRGEALFLGGDLMGGTEGVVLGFGERGPDLERCVGVW